MSLGAAEELLNSEVSWVHLPFKLIISFRLYKSLLFLSGLGIIKGLIVHYEGQERCIWSLRTWLSRVCMGGPQNKLFELNKMISPLGQVQDTHCKKDIKIIPSKLCITESGFYLKLILRSESRPSAMVTTEDYYYLISDFPGKNFDFVIWHLFWNQWHNAGERSPHVLSCLASARNQADVFHSLTVICLLNASQDDEGTSNTRHRSSTKYVDCPQTFVI